MEEEELAEERRVVREAEEEETGARSAPGSVTGETGSGEKYLIYFHVNKHLHS